MSVLRIKCFGKPQIWLDEAPLEQLVSTKAKATVFYLATTRIPASRELLAGLLWSDMPDRAARASLRVAISKLKSQLDQFLIINRREIGLNWKADVQIKVDVDHFVDDSSKPMRKAVKVYSGRFLDDFNLRDAPLFTEWVIQQQNIFQQKAIRYLGQLATAEAESGNANQAIEDWRHLLNLEPWNEAAHQELMQVLAKSGQRTAALLQYDQCQQSLRNGLDIDPSAETIKIYQQIKTSSLEVQPKHKLIEANRGGKETPNNLQAESLSFIGRQSESQKVIELLTSDRCSLLTITGTGGIGKTRLANECAHQLLDYFEDGVFLASLVSTTSANLIPVSVAAAIDLSLQGQKTPQAQLVDYLSNKNLLLILDNFEHLLEGIGFLTDLMAVAPNIKLLITSREPLGIGSEWVLPLTGLPHSADLEQPAARLFTTRAQRLDLSFVPEQEQTDIGRICQLVEGMPLAIELASAWVRVISCHEIAAEIESNLDFLATDLDLVPAHQRSIRAVFAYSWSLLTEEAQEGFAKLAIFRGGFTRQSANEVAGVTLRTLTTLVDKSLLQKKVGGRFHIHPLLRQFGLDQLTLPEKTNISSTYASYFATLLSKQKPAMYSENDPELLELVQSELENIRAVWEWLTLNRSEETLIELLIPITGYYFQRRNLFYEGVDLFNNVLTGNGKWKPETKAQVLIQAASFDSRLGRFDDCTNRLNEAVPILKQADQIEEAAEGLYYLGVVFCRRGEYANALEQITESFSIFSTFNNEPGCARTTNVLGMIAASEGNYSEAEMHYRAALNIYQTSGYQKEISNLLSNLGSVYGRQGQYEKALSFYQESEKIAKQVNESMGTAVILSNLGSVSRALQQFENAIFYYEESLRLTIEIGDQRWIAANYIGLGITYFDKHRYAEAIENLKRGFITALAIEAFPDVLTAISQLGRVAKKIGKLKSAASWLTFVANQPETPALSQEDAEKSLMSLSRKLTDLDKQEILDQALNWSFDDVRQSIETTFN